MGYVIELRLVAESDTGLLIQGGEILTFETKELAQEFGRKELKNIRYIASWEAISQTGAIKKGHKIYPKVN